MTRDELNTLGSKILSGHRITAPEAFALAAIPDRLLWDLTALADKLRRQHKGNRIHTCTILNGKSGKCSEDCGFCSQSQSATTDSPVYPLMSKEAMQEAAHAAIRSGVDRFSVVTSGRGLPKDQVRQVSEAFGELPHTGTATQWCASLGILAEPELRTLREAGVTRFHHNLETARSHFPNICQSHSYDDRIATVKAAQAVGMSVCVGGIFGLGETDEQAAEYALELRELKVDSVPMNFLIPVAGTKMEGATRITPRRCLKLIAMFRLILPHQDILICGGREDNLKELHPLAVLAGANGIMTGNYLTRDGRTLEKDRAMLDSMGAEHGLRIT
jgi:biotin synthase